MQLLKRGASQPLREISCARSAIVLPDLAPGILPVVVSWQISTPCTGFRLLSLPLPLWIPQTQLRPLYNTCFSSAAPVRTRWRLLLI